MPQGTGLSYRGHWGAARNKFVSWKKIHFSHLSNLDFSGVTELLISRAETNIRNVTNEPFSKRTNIRIFVRFDY